MYALKETPYSYLVREIKSRVSISQAAWTYGVLFNQKGFTHCPFHIEKTPSFTIKDDFAHCFGCGWHGDVIKFTMDMFHIDFAGALDKLNVDFGLALPINRKPTVRERLDAEQRLRSIQAEHQAYEELQERYDRIYNALLDEWVRLDRNHIAYKPTDPNEPIHPLYVEAVTRISQIEWYLDNITPPAKKG